LFYLSTGQKWPPPAQPISDTSPDMQPEMLWYGQLLQLLRLLNQPLNQTRSSGTFSHRYIGDSVNQPRRFAGCTNLQLLCQLDQLQTCLSSTCSHLHRVDSVYKPRCCIPCALLQLHHCLHDMSTHRRSIDRDSAECS